MEKLSGANITWSGTLAQDKEINYPLTHVSNAINNNDNTVTITAPGNYDISMILRSSATNHGCQMNVFVNGEKITSLYNHLTTDKKQTISHYLSAGDIVSVKTLATGSTGYTGTGTVTMIKTV